MKILLFAVSVLVLVGCNPDAHSAELGTPEWVEFHIRDVRVGVNKPFGWRLYLEETHATLVEPHGAVHKNGQLSGIIVNIWQPALKADPDQGDSTALTDQLGEVMQTTRIVNQAVVMPRSFRWDGHDAAYYMINGETHNMTLVIAVTPGQDTVLGFNISAPASQADRLADLLPQLFDGLRIDGQVVENGGLREIQRTLVSSVTGQGAEAAMEVSPNADRPTESGVSAQD